MISVELILSLCTPIVYIRTLYAKDLGGDRGLLTFPNHSVHYCLSLSDLLHCLLNKDI